MKSSAGYRRPRLRYGITAAAGVAACVALVAGCASSDADTGAGNADVGGGAGASLGARAAGVVGDQPDGGTPVDGGTLSFAGYSVPSSLDPTRTQPSGSTGGTAMASVYDLLMRYDAEKSAYVPQLAESLTESDDHLSWTLTLRDGVLFSDGTPLDADAVIASINRFNDKRGANSQEWLGGVRTMTAPDQHTVVFTLNQPWREFPAMLAYGHGMILAPAAYADPDTFVPIGAGPFVVASFAPAQSIDMAPRKDYWAGAPHVAALKFVGIEGSQPKLDALETGGVQMAYLRDADVVQKAETRYPGFVERTDLADVIQINAREGRPGADPLVRKAIAAAIDPEVLNERAFNGAASPGSEIFQDWSQWHTDNPGPKYDPAEAKRLLDQAKAGGFDGAITYASVNDPSSRDYATATQAMLDSVGFSVDVEYVATVTDMVKRMYVDHDFDLTHGAYNIADAVPYLRLSSALRSNSSNNILGYDSPQMDGLLDRLQQAPTDDAEREVLGEIQRLVTDDVPFLPTGAAVSFVPWADNVHGAVSSSSGIMLLGGVWFS